MWLSWLVTSMEADWEERLRLASEIVGSDETAASKLVVGSMIYQYVIGNEGRNGRRRIMRAILANGVQKSQNEFSEVWKNETRERKKKNEEYERPSKKVNLDEGEFGDYDVDEDEDDIMEDAGEGDDGDVTLVPDSDRARSRQSQRDPKDTFQLGTTQLGGIEAVQLRHRLLTLLFRLSCELPHEFTDAEDFLDLYTEFMRSLSLPQFSVLAMNPYFDPQSNICLIVNHLIPLLAAPLPPAGVLQVTQDDLVRDYIPRAANANSTVDNAKAST